MDARDREAERDTLNDERLQNAGVLRAVYQAAAEDLVRLRGSARTEWSQEFYERRLATLQERMGDLLQDTAEWAEEELPDSYQAGLELRVNDFDELGLPLQGGFEDLHEEQVADLTQAFMEGAPDHPDERVRQVSPMAEVNRYCYNREHRRYNELAAAATARGKLAGETVTETTQRLLDSYEAEGVKGFRDKSGREWNLVDYAYMNARTVSRLADEMAQETTDLEQGFDLQTVLVATNACSKCTPWADEVVSITGQTKGYPTKADWRASGAGHPHCTCAFSTYLGT